jgi:hypothetical protein
VSEKEFMNWLRGFFELAKPVKLNQDQVAIIKEKMAQIKPEESSPTVQILG